MASLPVRLRVESFLERALLLEHGANILPLLQVYLYYRFLLVLMAPGAITSSPLRAALWLALLLLNFSLSVGIQHLHCHRPIFTAPELNRIFEILLALPSFSPGAGMRVLHLYHHHGGDNGPRDPSSTRGHERGWHALAYWLTYSTHGTLLTCRALFRRDAPRAFRGLRGQFLLDVGLFVGTTILFFRWNPSATIWVRLVPLAITHVATGYFSWLTHAPARHEEGARNGSINTVNNLMNLFIFNQGYHSIHHRYPGLHWTEIPEKLDLLFDVDEELIVPYWVTLNSAWRLACPQRFLDGKHGRSWKARYAIKRARGRVRSRVFPYFVWV